MPKSLDQAEMALRMPRSLKDWVEREAQRDERSQNTVVVRILRERMLAEQREVR